LVGEQDLATAQHFYESWGIYAVTLGRAIGGPAEWLVLIAGILGMKFSRALVVLTIGGFSAAFVTAWLGRHLMSMRETAG
jgi:membrane protein DedA with SNARE-associated domain